jgi:ABC-2 type transport system ATP-binding protein
MRQLTQSGVSCEVMKADPERPCDSGIRPSLALGSGYVKLKSLMPETLVSEPILRVQNLNIRFQANVHCPRTWRDVFIQFLMGPLSFFRNDTEPFFACRDISFDIHRSDRIGLLGVNGAGKTTLCRCIAGYYQPTSGHVKKNGEIRALFDVALGIQPELTGRENASLLAELLYAGDKDIKNLTAEALQFSELGPSLDKPFKFYSRGMQTRLGLSLSAIRPSDLLILDEVFDGADMFFRDKISARMLDVVHQSGAVIFVSHSVEQIRKVCNRVVVLQNGSIIFDGAVEEGLQCYENLRPSVGRLHGL